MKLKVTRKTIFELFWSIQVVNETTNNKVRFTFEQMSFRRITDFASVQFRRLVPTQVGNRNIIEVAGSDDKQDILFYGRKYFLGSLEANPEHVCTVQSVAKTEKANDCGPPRQAIL